MKKNNSRKAFQIVKDLTKQKQSKVSTILGKDGKCLTEASDIIGRWTEYCQELYNHQTKEDPEVLEVPESLNYDNFPILKEEVEVAVRSLKSGNAAGVDNISAELIKNDKLDTNKNLQQDLADRSMARNMDTITNYNPTQER